MAPTKTVEVSDRNIVVQDHLPLVKWIAGRVHCRLPRTSGVERRDLIQEGILGLISALENYDESLKVPFVVYASFRIRGAMLDSVRKLDPVSRYRVQQRKDLDRAAGVLAASQGGGGLDGTCGPLRAAADGMRWSAAVLRHPLRVECSVQDEESTPQLPANPALQPDAMASLCESRRTLRIVISSLGRRARKVVRLHALCGLTLRETGLRIGLSESRACQIYKQALGDMAQRLQRRGIQSAADLLPCHSRSGFEAEAPGEIGLLAVNNEN
jgi:RNA polymerase sigma factor for flagellar operon FliA